MIANNCNLQFVSNKKSVSPSVISLINSKHYNLKKKKLFSSFSFKEKKKKQSKNTSLFCLIYKTNVPKFSSLHINSSKTHANYSFANTVKVSTCYSRKLLLSVSLKKENLQATECPFCDFEDGVKALASAPHYTTLLLTLSRRKKDCHQQLQHNRHYLPD